MRIPPRISRPLRLAFLCAAVFGLLMTMPPSAQKTADAQARRYQLRVQNDSRWDIHRIYMSSSEEDNWGPDQLGRRILRSGTAHTITDIIPGEYDIRFVDEDGDKCDLRNIPIFKNTNWVLTNRILLNCYS